MKAMKGILSLILEDLGLSIAGLCFSSPATPRAGISPHPEPLHFAPRYQGTDLVALLRCVTNIYIYNHLHIFTYAAYYESQLAG